MEKESILSKIEKKENSVMNYTNMRILMFSVIIVQKEISLF